MPQPPLISVVGHRDLLVGKFGAVGPPILGVFSGGFAEHQPDFSTCNSRNNNSCFVRVQPTVVSPLQPHMPHPLNLAPPVSESMKDNNMHTINHMAANSNWDVHVPNTGMTMAVAGTNCSG
ncbi:hypothetical protein Ancab_023591 [Ancistrocladus abbreviatus]